MKLIKDSVLINVYTASPKRIKEIDSSKLGSGQNVIKYAAGMHFGSKNVAGHYLKDYKNYKGADETIYHNQMEVPVDSQAYKVITLLNQKGMNEQTAKEALKDSPELLDTLDFLMGEESSLLDIVIDKGIIYETSLKHIDFDDLPYWGDGVSSEIILEISEVLLDRTIKGERLMVEDWDALNLDEFSTCSEMVDEAFDAAVQWCEDNDIEFTGDNDEMRKIWAHYAIGDTLLDSNLYDDFYDTLYNSPQFDAMQRVINGDFNLHSEMEIGEVYCEIANILSQPGDTPNQTKQRASDFFAKDMRVPGVMAKNTHFEEYEVIIFDQDVLKNATFKELNHQEFYNDYDDKIENKLIRGHEENKYRDSVSVSISMRRR